jgi:hypothetical protein
VVKQTTLNTLLPGSIVGNPPRVGNIRYNRMHNSLLVATTTNAPGSGWSTAFEVDLGLTTARVIGSVWAGGNQVGLDFNEATGEIYFTGRHVGGDQWNGDLLSMDYTTGATTELINGSNKTADNYSPWSIIYRGTIADGGTRPTVLMPQGNNWDQNDHLYEYYRDADDASGDLLQRGADMVIPSAAMGQLDEVTGTVWMGALYGWIYGVKSDDTVVTFIGGYWSDVDSPPYNPCNDPFADSDKDGDVDQLDFAALQRCFTGGSAIPPSQSVECGCLDRGDDDFDGDPDSDGDIDERDLIAFEQCSSGPGIEADVCCDGGSGCP